MYLDASVFMSDIYRLLLDVRKYVKCVLSVYWVSLYKSIKAIFKASVHASKLLSNYATILKLNILFSKHLLFMMNIMNNFICIDIADMWGKRKEHNELQN